MLAVQAQRGEWSCAAGFSQRAKSSEYPQPWVNRRRGPAEEEVGANDLTSSTTLAKLEQQVSALKVQLLSATNDLTNAKEDCLAYEAENEKVRVATPQKLGKMLPSSRSAHPTADGPTGTQIRMPDPK